MVGAMIAEDDKAKESYLVARGWVRVQRPIPYVEHWMLACYETDDPQALIGKNILFTLDGAVKRQLWSDARGMLYLFESLESKPETRKLIGGQLVTLISGALKEMAQDKVLLADLAEKLKTAGPASLEALMRDKEFRDGVEAIRMLWHMTDSRGPSGPKGQAN